VIKSFSSNGTVNLICTSNGASIGNDFRFASIELKIFRLTEEDIVDREGTFGKGKIKRYFSRKEDLDLQQEVFFAVFFLKIALFLCCLFLKTYIIIGMGCRI
jgi:hypothetical protein